MHAAYAASSPPPVLSRRGALFGHHIGAPHFADAGPYTGGKTRVGTTLQLVVVTDKEGSRDDTARRTTIEMPMPSPRHGDHHGPHAAGAVIAPSSRERTSSADLHGMGQSW